MTDKRKAILKATLKLISENGFHGTPMSQIAEEADVGAGTIYRYFESKEVLIHELFLEVKREISQAMLSDISPEGSTEEIFRQAWLNTFNFCLQNPQEMIFLEQFYNSPFQTPETEAATLEYLAPAISVFQKAVEAGELKDMPFEMLTMFVHDVTVASAKRHISGALVMDETKLEIVVQACWDAVKAN
ncbi:MAG: TetR/AcrR family transcriptional regulator [Chloroflexota bacterium]|nr:MAG: TetR/AcrR family transcriptional regulator [Chloroflexota bacterium]